MFQKTFPAIFSQHTFQKYMPRLKRLLYSLNIKTILQDYAAVSDVT